MFMNSMLNVAGGLALITLSTPAVVFGLVPLFIVYYRVQATPLLLLILVWACIKQQSARLSCIADCDPLALASTPSWLAHSAQPRSRQALLKS